MRKRDKVPDGKKRYSVGGTITISMHTEVIASSPEEARRIAESRGIMSLCHGCASEDATEQWVTSGELDCDMPEPYSDQDELEVVEMDV